MKKRSALTSALIVVGFAVILSFMLFKLSYIIGIARWLLMAVESLVWGAAIAFILNVPMRAIENLLARMDRKNRTKRFRRALSLLLTLAALAGVVYLMLTLIIPELYRTLLTIIDMIPSILRRVDNFLKGYNIDILDMILSTSGTPQTSADVQKQLLSALDILISGLSFSTSVVSSVASSIMDVFFSVLFAIYILSSKEKLSSQARKLAYSWLPIERADTLVDIGRMTHSTCSSFIAGQCTEAVILGAMFFVTMTLFKMPYALLVSVFISITAVIPLVGAWMGCLVGALLILIDNPMTAFWFVIMFLVLQQIEGNLIYPQVVGNSIGLKPIWTLAAVVIGQGLFGIFGMLIFIPLASVLYTLVRRAVSRRLSDRAIPPEKLE